MTTDQQVAAFQKVVWDYFEAHGRHDLPWRLPEPDGSFDPYKILVSEIMLQQTQVVRVRPKYEEFLRTFPTVQKLAAATLGDVLVAWQGLGYNRRAKYLWQAAQKIAQDYGGKFPQVQTELATLPGIGPNTAGAIMTYAFNKPATFIETNIRTIFIHHFFPAQTSVADSAIRELVSVTLPQTGKSSDRFAVGEFEFTSKGNNSLSDGRKLYAEPKRAFLEKSSEHGVKLYEKPTMRAAHYRVWYWALMDYGVYLKQTVGNVSRASKSYAKQSKFEGSLRQIRGHVLRQLSHGPHTFEELSGKITDVRLTEVLKSLESEDLIRYRSKKYRLF